MCVNHVVITLGKDNSLDMVRNMACARRYNMATELHPHHGMTTYKPNKSMQVYRM